MNPYTLKLSVEFEKWAKNEMLSGKLPTWSDCSEWWIAKLLEREEELYRLMEEKKASVKDLWPNANIDLPTEELAMQVMSKDLYNKALKDCQSLLIREHTSNNNNEK